MSHGLVWWSECVSKDVDKARAHYEAVAGWTFDEMPMAQGGTYYIAKVGDKPVAGLMSVTQLDHEVPPHWMTYIAVADINEAVKAAKDTGGTILREPFNVPGVGTIAMVSEPGGAVAGFIEPAEMPPS
ncbi:MAG: VOC family protein [Pseudomonadota bacterium]